jgi:hypothetical protein
MGSERKSKYEQKGICQYRTCYRKSVEPNKNELYSDLGLCDIHTRLAAQFLKTSRPDQ